MLCVTFFEEFCIAHYAEPCYSEQQDDTRYSSRYTRYERLYDKYLLKAVNYENIILFKKVLIFKLNQIEVRWIAK